MFNKSKESLIRLLIMLLLLTFLTIAMLSQNVIAATGYGIVFLI
jgi:hypothetical protein